MGIKMGKAFDAAGAEWEAETYSKGKGKEPLRCIHCPAGVVHQSAHPRELEEKSVLIPAYFRLRPKHRHAVGCKYAVVDEIKTIAKESQDLLETIREGQYRLRLVMIKEALTELATKPSSGRGGQGAGSSKTYERARSKMPGYINTAKRVLAVRALCDSDDEIAEHLELVFEGNTVVPWSQFYFETERHLDAYHELKRKTVEHPIALHGIVKSKRLGAGKDGKHVINLAKPKYIAASDTPEQGIGVEVSVWCKDEAWFSGVAEGAEIVVLGMWENRAGKVSDPVKPGRYKSFVTHKLTLEPILITQIAKVKSK